jgi:hypothetical protein
MFDLLMSENKRPTGIIRTLPALYGDASISAKKFKAAIKRLESGDDEAVVYIALAQKPRIEVLHMYLLIEGKVSIRLNIAGYEDGHAAECFDRTIRTPKYWAVCTGPVSRPPEPVKMRGFQGIRYTEGLW